MVRKAKGAVVTATEKSIREAKDALTPRDAAALAALRVLAQKIDDMVDVPDFDELDEDGGPKKTPPPLDNVTIPTFLKYLESLGLTPAGRKALAAAGKSPAEGGGTRGVRTKSNLQLLREEAAEAG